MVTHSATIPLDVLLRQYQLDLVQITNVEDEDASQAPVQWVHGSDLLDPTPFLTPRTVLLTTGAQFSSIPNAAKAQRQYVAALVDAGVCALGFAVNFTFERIPEALIHACEQQKLPLFRVPYSTPFIAISQTAARLLNQQSRARDAWSIAAQRAVALAALQPDGLRAVVRELSTQLGGWVAIYDSTGNPLSWAPQQASAAVQAPWLNDDVRLMLRNQTRASRPSTQGNERVSLQTLGRGGQLLGVLAVHNGGDLDYAAQSVLGIVVALASLTLEQRSSTSAATDQLRASILHLLEAGQLDLAQQVATDVVGTLPAEPIVCARLTPADAERDNVSVTLRTLEQSLSADLFWAQRGSDLVIICSVESRQKLVNSLTGLTVAVGLSDSFSYSLLTDALQQASIALEAARTRTEDTVLTFTPSMQSGVLELLSESQEAQTRARALLAPLVVNDERHGEELLHSLEVWLSENGQFAPAASELGIHRHTLKTRIARIGQIIGRDLNSFETRAELWASLRLAAGEN